MFDEMTGGKGKHKRLYRDPDLNNLQSTSRGFVSTLVHKSSKHQISVCYCVSEMRSLGRDVDGLCMTLKTQIKKRILSSMCVSSFVAFEVITYVTCFTDFCAVEFSLRIQILKVKELI